MPRSYLKDMGIDITKIKLKEVQSKSGASLYDRCIVTYSYTTKDGKAAEQTVSLTDFITKSTEKNNVGVGSLFIPEQEFSNSDNEQNKDLQKLKKEYLRTEELRLKNPKNVLLVKRIIKKQNEIKNKIAKIKHEELRAEKDLVSNFEDTLSAYENNKTSKNLTAVLQAEKLLQNSFSRTILEDESSIIYYGRPALSARNQADIIKACCNEFLLSYTGENENLLQKDRPKVEQSHQFLLKDLMTNMIPSSKDRLTKNSLIQKFVITKNDTPEQIIDKIKEQMKAGLTLTVENDKEILSQQKALEQLRSTLSNRTDISSAHVIKIFESILKNKKQLGIKGIGKESRELMESKLDGDLKLLESTHEKMEHFWPKLEKMPAGEKDNDRLDFYQNFASEYKSYLKIKKHYDDTIIVLGKMKEASDNKENQKRYQGMINRLNEKFNPLKKSVEDKMSQFPKNFISETLPHEISRLREGLEQRKVEFDKNMTSITSEFDKIRTPTINYDEKIREESIKQLISETSSLEKELRETFDSVMISEINAKFKILREGNKLKTSEFKTIIDELKDIHAKLKDNFDQKLSPEFSRILDKNKELSAFLDESSLLDSSSLIIFHDFQKLGLEKMQHTINKYEKKLAELIAADTAKVKASKHIESESTASPSKTATSVVSKAEDVPQQSAQPPHPEQPSKNTTQTQESKISKEPIIEPEKPKLPDIASEATPTKERVLSYESQKIVSKLQQYIDKIEVYKPGNTKEIDFKNNFWLMRDSRAKNRNINYIIAKNLLAKIKNPTDDIKEIFSEKSLQKICEDAGKEVGNTNYREKDIHSSDLNSAIRLARDSTKPPTHPDRSPKR